MQPPKKKVLIMSAVSLGIIVMSFVIPIYIVPAYIGISNASSCAVSTGCAEDTFSKCGGYQSSGEPKSFTDSLDNGMKGMLCMMGLDSGEANAILGGLAESRVVTLNKIQSPIE